MNKRFLGIMLFVQILILVLICGSVNFSNWFPIAALWIGGILIGISISEIFQEHMERGGVARLTKTVDVSYKAVAIGDSETKDGDIKIKGLSFFCDNLLVYAEMQQDEFILGLNNHTYLEFKRVVSTVGGNTSKNQFQLIGVRSVDSLDQHQVILLQGVLLDQRVDYLSL